MCYAGGCKGFQECWSKYSTPETNKDDRPGILVGRILDPRKQRGVYIINTLSKSDTACGL